MKFGNFLNQPKTLFVSHLSTSHKTMNDRDEIEMANTQEEGKTNEENQADITIDDDLREIEDYKGDDIEMAKPSTIPKNKPREKKVAKQVYYEEQDDEYDDEEEEIDPSEFPSTPCRSILLSLLLVIAGIGSIVFGTYCYIHKESITKVIIFMVLGLCLTSPGCIYSAFICQAARARTPEDKEDLLNQIPI